MGDTEHTWFGFQQDLYKYKYKYDNKGNLIEQKIYVNHDDKYNSIDGMCRLERAWISDKFGNIIEVIKYNELEEPIEKTEYIYTK